MYRCKFAMARADSPKTALINDNTTGPIEFLYVAGFLEFYI